ncbi:Protein OS9-like [Arabidopsis thaliana x Arabidopsis arenosa]|uniref:Protein OS-9 homolog n=1 Tax=Arabidopsis thaliana x Arabidopsis arenosa TaxID=1240361 RepID=A0A8T1YCK1_9BRAS|nr:Protein OS9-like [Arabidopsis thaliana x Arabidopsis arenosa]
MKMRITEILLCLVIVALSSSSHVWSDQIFPAHLVGTFSRNNREPKYKIDFLPEDSPFHPGDNLESMVMLDKDGNRFLCYLPKEEKATSGWTSSQQNISTVMMETQKQVKLKTPDELLQPLSEKCLLRQEGWWSYEFCHQKFVRQLHVEDENKIVQEFFLGTFDPEATAAFNQTVSDISTDASQRYHSHVYTNGTTCDLTGSPREVEVRFVCAETRAMITSITELSTCKYALTVQCPTLCKHPLFQLEKPVSHTIHCNAIPVEQDATRNNEEQIVGESPKMIADS